MPVSRADVLDCLMPGLLELFHGGCPKSKEQAKRAGKKLYYDNLPCSKGHFSMKKLNGHCQRCAREKNHA